MRNSEVTRMWHETKVGRELFELLLRIDERLAERLRAGRCTHCGGPLCAGHYERKPRGGSIAGAGEEAEFRLRFSFCCGREGCRKRATPPSVRFLGRKVYVEVAILVACAVVPLIEQTRRAIREATGISARTIGRWQQWWRTVFVSSALWVEARARRPELMPEDLPGALIERFAGSDAAAKLVATTKFLSPLTTTSVDGSRFAREVM